MLLRSYLYVPGDNQKFLAKAEVSTSDAIILDLEDSVKSDAKKFAEESVAQFLDASKRSNLMVRVEPTRLKATKDLINHPKVTKIYLPKVESSRDISEFNKLNQKGKPINALIESAVGLENIREIAQSENVESIGIGEADFFADIVLTSEISQSLLDFVRSRLVIASAANNLLAPIAPVSSNFKDLEMFEKETRELFNFGYWGRACIHPNQVEIVNRVFQQEEILIERARAIIASLESDGRGATSGTDGSMIDAAHLRWALRYLALDS